MQTRIWIEYHYLHKTLPIKYDYSTVFIIRVSGMCNTHFDVRVSTLDFLITAFFYMNSQIVPCFAGVVT